ncbi:MAG TPA: glutamate-cysteine ligase family protein [Acidimicrobiales bacterium]|nr:glutamate-cysteine ligase family protein [Acidimicrobiales bacterium]
MPTSQPLVGLELEFLTFATSDRGRPSIDVLERITRAPLASGGRVTCEPGGQLEVSSPPAATTSQAIAATTRDVAELHDRARAEGIDLVSVGADRWRPPTRVVDSVRYRAMEAHFDRLGRAGRQMMCNTAALQLNLGVTPTNHRDRWQVAHLIGPAMVAAFANSPNEAGTNSTRLATWMAMEPARTAAVRADRPLPDGWIEYAWAAPTLVARGTDGSCISLPVPLRFGEWLERGSPIGYPTVDDLTYHLTMLFPPVRPRGWLEIRYLDALPSPWWEVATMVVTALLDDALLGEARRAVAGTHDLWFAAAGAGLEDERLAVAADNCFALAVAATGDAGVIEYLERYVARRVPSWA